MKITKAVISLAGLGTRFSPASKMISKELFPVFDKPIVQHLVEEAVASGITEIILVTRPRSLVGQYFLTADHPSVEYLRTKAKFTFITQDPTLPYGNGTPILAAAKEIGREPFVYMFGDDLVLSDTPCTKQLIDTFLDYSCNAVVAFQRVETSEVSKYGIGHIDFTRDPHELIRVIEKPSQETAPSNYAQLGRFVLTHATVQGLKAVSTYQLNELYLTYAINSLCSLGRVLAHPICGTWYTTGDPMNFALANMAYAMKSKEGHEYPS